jgi:hypothetical protein
MGAYDFRTRIQGAPAEEAFRMRPRCRGDATEGLAAGDDVRPSGREETAPP